MIDGLVVRTGRRAGTLLLALLSALAMLALNGALISPTPAQAGGGANPATVTGRLTDQSGRPAARVQVTVEPIDGGGRPTYSASTNGAGRWLVPSALAGRYRITYTVPGLKAPRYYPGRVSHPVGFVTVPATGRLVVDDVLPRSGRVRFVASDAVTGAKVRDFCVGHPLDLGFHCTATTSDGYVDLELPPGAYRFSGSGTDGVHEGGMVEATVVAGQVTRAKLPLQPPGAELSVVLRDAVTGAPVPNVNVTALPVDKRFPDLWDYTMASDDQGVVRFQSLHPDRYNLWVSPGDGVHGAQWVGPTGGTGDRASALVVEPPPGVGALPDIRLDGAGSITGSITDAVTGEPVSATIALMTFDPLWRDTTPKVFGDGSYTFSGLGPYEWSLAFIPQGNSGASSPYATQWSGGAPNSVEATRIQVVAGGTTVANETLSAGTVVSGKANGLPWYDYLAPLYAYNADTHDIVAVDDNVEDGRFDVRLLPGQEVKFCLSTVRCHPDFTRLADATAFPIGTSPLTVDFPGPRP